MGAMRWLSGERTDSLLLFRLNPRMTKPLAPGPAPISKRDWAPIANRYLKNHSVILHTDGARAYKMEGPGVAHYNVVHKNKKVMARWVRPHYTKVFTHKLPTGKTIQVKSGTQIIDRFWGHLRTYLKHTARQVGSLSLMRKVRAAQWTYSYRGTNLWASAGHMLREL